MKRAKKTPKKQENLWVNDGLVGVIALLIYNVLLYFFTSIGIRGIIEEMKQTTGSFLIESFHDFGFGPSQTALGIIIVFVIAFVLGIGIGNLVRKRRGMK